MPGPKLTPSQGTESGFGGFPPEGEASHLPWEVSSPPGKAINVLATPTKVAAARAHSHPGSNDTLVFFPVKWTVLNLLTDSLTDYL